jgi:hypothetical protein
MHGKVGQGGAIAKDSFALVPGAERGRAYVRCTLCGSDRAYHLPMLREDVLAMSTSEGSGYRGYLEGKEPPERKSYGFPATVAAVGLVLALLGPTSSIIGAVMVTGAASWIHGNFLYNRNELPALERDWARAYFCGNCLNRFYDGT